MPWGPFDRRFHRIRTDANGYLKPSVYRRLYHCGRRAAEGILLDIGPGQGASSISLGLAVRDSGKRDSTVCSIEFGRFSNALQSQRDSKHNERVLRENLERYGVAGTSLILMGPVHEAADRVPVDRPISLLFIDADGAIDRDFELFFNRLAPGAPVVIDDYEFRLSREFLDFDDADIEKHLQKLARQGKPAASFGDLVPLGKHYTTFRMVNRLVEAGLLVRDRVVRNTFFGHKPGSLSAPVDLAAIDLRRVRESIATEYDRLREAASRGVTSGRRLAALLDHPGVLPPRWRG